MVVINPDKYVRLAYKTPLETVAEVFEKKVPKDGIIRNKYYLISTQKKNEIERSKDGYEWLVSIVIECVSIQDLGFASSVSINDMEEHLISVVDSGLNIAGFDLKETTFVDSIPLDIDTPTNSIYRRVVTYQHWLNRKITT